MAEEASATKSAFLSSVSHELRTPLTSVVGLLAAHPAAARRGRLPGRPGRRAEARPGDAPGGGQPRDHHRGGRAADRAHQRHPRPGQDRGGPDGVAARAGRRRRGHRAGDGRDRLAARRRRARDGRRGAGRPADRHRRPRPPDPGRHQPDLERGQVHPDRDHHVLGRADRGRRSLAAHRQRRGYRHRASHPRTRRGSSSSSARLATR